VRESYRNWCLLVVTSLYLLVLLTGCSRQQVKANNGSTAIKGDVINSTINNNKGDVINSIVNNNGVSPTDVAKMTAQLQVELQVSQGQIRAALEILGEANVPPERMPSKLVEIAKRLKTLQATVYPGDDPAIAALKAEAQKAIYEGNLSQADGLLEKVAMEQGRASDLPAVNVSETFAWRGDIAMARLRYGEAAKHFAHAAEILAPAKADEADEWRWLHYLESEANAYYVSGLERGDNPALRTAIDRYRTLVKVLGELTPNFTLARAANLANLGDALIVQADRDDGPTGALHIAEAVEVYREALKIQARVPSYWAGTKNSLGVALVALGERENGPERFEEAIQTYREALTVRTEESEPLGWARTQHNLGRALSALGELEEGTARYVAAVKAYREALKEQRREREPAEWAKTKSYLGRTLVSLGVRASASVAQARHEAAGASHQDDSTEQLIETGVDDCREASKVEEIHARAPLDWAEIQSNLCYALYRQGELETGTQSFEHAIVVCHKALDEQSSAPADRAETNTNLGNALAALGERTGESKPLREAIAAYREALKVARARKPLQWARSLGDQGVALTHLAALDLAKSKQNPGDRLCLHFGHRFCLHIVVGAALLKISSALETASVEGHAPYTAYFGARLRDAKFLRMELKR
jgi:tetratricopeptide (TPR) repeat protein